MQVRIAELSIVPCAYYKHILFREAMTEKDFAMTNEIEIPKNDREKIEYYIEKAHELRAEAARDAVRVTAAFLRKQAVKLTRVLRNPVKGAKAA